jgi:enoyl-[acyl-carrier protein] reductase / trans-2-enoyl-CoA reductase (NAD+)
MAMQVIEQRKRGFICVNSHPEGCRRNVEQQIAQVHQSMPQGGGLRNVLVVGASTGYGLASRIAAAWGLGARTLGVFFERPPKEGATATAGFYNTVGFHQAARRDGLAAFSLNGDAFSDEIKRQAAEIIRKDMGPLDLVIYSLASPRRVHPHTRQTYDSALKPVGETFSSKSIDLKHEKVIDVTLEPAGEKEIADTITVMGGEDWRMWMDMLLSQGLLAQGACTFAYSYIGPQVTWPIYRDGTIGRAKQDLEITSRELNQLLGKRLGGSARISVNKAVVTQASSAIPVVPLYLSILPPVMRELGGDEMPIDQMIRLFRDFLAGGDTHLLDAEGRVRLDTMELRPSVQARVAKVWVQVRSENLYELTDFKGFKRAFDNLFGFGVEGVDYTQPVETDLSW